MSIAAPPITIPVELRNRFQRNMAELTSHQPEVAARLAVISLPENIVPTVGRDGQLTFRLNSDGGKSVWFGGSSMPSISAGEIMGEIAADGGNVILPAIMTGHEPLALLHRVHRTAAVFVVEPDAANLVMAMHLCDYAQALESGRLIFVLLSTLHADLSALFRRYPGYVMPARMITSPLLKHGQMDVIQRQISAAAAHVFSIQNDLMAAAQSRLAAWKPSAFSPHPRIALLDAGTDQSPAETILHLARALRREEWPHVATTQNHPRQMHMAAVLSNVAALNPEVLFCINGTGRRMSDSIPAEIPIMSWFLPEASLSADAPGKTISRSIYFASSTGQRDRLLGLGCPPERLAVCPIGLDVAEEANITGEKSAANDTMDSDMVIAPQVDGRPHALNVTLPSHVRLWTRLQEMARKAASENDRRESESLVRQAMRDIGMTGDDPNVVGFFSRVFVERLLPSEHLRTAEAALERFSPAPRRYSPDVFRRWAAGLRSRHGPEIAEKSIGARGVRLAVIPCDFAQKSSCLLEAMAMGVAVVIRITGDDAIPESSDFPDLSPLIFSYRSPAGLADAIRTAASVSLATRTEIARRVRTEHTMAKRLEFMVTTLRLRLEGVAGFAKHRKA